ncbi:hypothetical protein BG006_003194, partial [Podila minutissima]
YWLKLAFKCAFMHSFYLIVDIMLALHAINSAIGPTATAVAMYLVHSADYVISVSTFTSCSRPPSSPVALASIPATSINNKPVYHSSASINATTWFDTSEDDYSLVLGRSLSDFQFPLQTMS